MKGQVFEFGDAPWPAGAGVLQVYMPVDLATNPELTVLIARWRTAMRDAPLTMVDDQSLHITLVISSCQTKRRARLLLGCQAR